MPKKAKHLPDREWFYKQYVENYKNSYEIALLLDCSQHTVYKILKKFKIKTRSNGEAKKLQNKVNLPQSKYQLLNDSEWLKNKYYTDNLSVRAIAKIVGCSMGNVLNAMSRHNIKRRINVEAKSLLPPNSHKYSQLNNKAWLYQKYIVDGFSTLEIGDDLGAGPNSIRQFLIRHDIPVRNISEGLTHDRESDGFVLNQEVFDGCMLGDAGMGCWSRDSDISNPYFYKRNKFKDHVEYVAKFLFPGTWRDKVKDEPNSGTNHDRTYYSIRSLSYDFLKPLDHKWYPKWNNYVKVVPEDLVITPVVLLHWFMDDGSSYRRVENGKPRGNGKQIQITMCTECFSPEQQRFLCEKINKQFNIKCSLYRAGEITERDFGYHINISQSQTPAFFELIGNPPVASLAYKWKCFNSWNHLICARKIC